QQEEDDEARELLQRSSQGKDQQEEGSEDPQTSQSLRPELTKRLLPYIHWLIRKDRKLTAWKELQGHIWREGYDRGELKAVLFPEVSECLKLWRQCGLALSVYSSGSVPAQQLLYGHSSDGDLRELFSHWFDTRIGPKQERKSYTAITEHIGGPAGQILFVSDAVRELQAAESAGLRVVFSDRVGNPERNAGGFASISSLRELIEPLLREWWSMPPAEG
ncbi:MAG: acireductone synthase, partial [Cyanobium sp.]